MGECFACSSPHAFGQYTLAFEDKTVEQVYLCDVCQTDFQEVSWMDVMVVAE